MYNFEFGENNKEIEIILPPPTYLVMNNSAQLIDNISQMADKIIDIVMPDQDDAIKAEWKRLYVVNNLAAYINFDMVDRNIELAKINVEANKPASTEDGDNSDMDAAMDDEL